MRFLRNLRAFGGPSWPFFFVSLEFFKFVILAIFAIFLTFSVFLDSRKNPCFFCHFSHKIFGELFSLRKLRREFANTIVPGHIYPIFFLLQFFTHCHAITYKPSNKAAGEVKRYHNLVLTDPGILGISIASAL